MYSSWSLFDFLLALQAYTIAPIDTTIAIAEKNKDETENQFWN